MIRQIRGAILSTGLSSVVVEASGFGIEVRVTSSEGLILGKEATLYTHLAIKQDGLELYGFIDPSDRDFFELILTIPGVGPKTALSVLRRASREAILGAISARDVSYLTRVVGLGKKSAEKMLVELADKVGEREHSDADGEVFDTLVALGYTEREARRALQSIPSNVVGKDARLKMALSAR